MFWKKLFGGKKSSGDAGASPKTKGRDTPAPEAAPDEVGAPLDSEPSIAGLELEERNGAVLGARIHTAWEMSADADALLAKVTAQHGEELVRLTLGLWSPEENSYDGLDQVITADRFPALRELFVGDYEYPEETEISWTTVGPIDGFFTGLPDLRWLHVRGGAIELSAAHHAKLRTLILETGALPAATARAVASGRLPRLEELVIWFGDSGYGADTTVDDFAPFFTNPSLGQLLRLTLGNAEMSDGLAERLAASPLATQLQELSFELGTLSDDGAKTLAAHAESFENLQKLSTDQNFVGAEGRAALEQAFGSKLAFGEQEEPDDFDGELHRYVSVGE